MDGGFNFVDMYKNVKKRRSVRHRQPLDDSQSHLDYREYSSFSSTPLSDSMSKASSEENAGHGANRRRELSLSQCISGGSYTNLSEAETAQKTNDGGQLGESNESGVSKFKKVKLKVGGVTHTIHAKGVSEGPSLAGSSSTKSSHSSDSYLTQHKLTPQDSPNEGPSNNKDRRSGLRGIPWKDFSKSGFVVRNVDTPSDGIPQSVNTKQLDAHHSARKSKRIPKSRLLGEVFDDAEENDDDDEIRYLEKLRTSRLASNYVADYEDEDEVVGKKQKIISRISDTDIYDYNGDMRYNYSRSDKENVLSRSGRAFQDTDYFEEETSSDDEPEPKKKRLSKEMGVSGDLELEMAVTTRRSALRRGKAISTIEFPTGLPPAPPKKQKEKLPEIEQQLKKAEAAQRRRLQVEKAAQEAEDEAIRKILGQDSSRKKQEEKLKRRQEELAQERAANSGLSSNAVRWVIGPSGTTVTFPNEIGLPSIFQSKHSSYPPPREKCAGPSCTNSYKYRDSKSKLPLCSLQCYKAINDKMQTLAAAW